MRKEIELKLLPAEAEQTELIRRRAIAKCRVKNYQSFSIVPLRRSIDARGSRPVVRLRLAVYIDESPPQTSSISAQLPSVATAKRCIIVGAGPAGYFAALELIEQGVRPIVFDRGKDVQARRRDLRAIQQFGEVHPHSNYCFGEGGAGTYSDGKLYTRSHKRGNIAKAMQLLVEHGAKPDILIDAHPHIGSNKLPGIVAAMRETILQHGGEIHFESQVTDLLLQQNKIEGVLVNDRDEHRASAVILATGHSARDVYYLLHRKGIRMEAKPFALGVRIEHPQALIDQIQYRQAQRETGLPAASYRLACQVQDRGVFSFCMCPGGLVVPAATAPGEIVINGMSLSRRDSAYANSGTVVAVELADLEAHQSHGVFKTLAFQRSVEQAMFNFSGLGTQQAPAQRLTDFVNEKISATLPDSSYIPGLLSAPVHRLLPPGIYRRLKDGIITFGKKMRGYYTAEANVIGTESRTSAPLRIPRDRTTHMHEDVVGLFPCGEGAGYAGGIISAAVDGQNVAKSAANFLKL